MLQMTKREQIGTIVLAGLLVVGLLLRVVLAPKPANIILEPPQQTEPSDMEKTEILVHVAGAVHQPGVYSLPEGARVVDAIKAAGGALPEANPHALNLAEPLYDGRRVHVPSTATEGSHNNNPENSKVNINTADVAELEKLPGIGPTKAAAIVTFREQQGPFRTLDDLAQVSGIGEKTVDTLREHITLY